MWDVVWECSEAESVQRIRIRISGKIFKPCSKRKRMLRFVLVWGKVTE